MVTGCIHIDQKYFIWKCISKLFLIQVFQDIVERTKVISETVSESATSFTFCPCFLANFSHLGMSEMPIKTMRVKHGANCIR